MGKKISSRDNSVNKSDNFLILSQLHLEIATDTIRPASFRAVTLQGKPQMPGSTKTQETCTLLSDEEDMFD